MLQEHQQRTCPNRALGTNTNEGSIQHWYEDLKKIGALSTSVPEQFQFREEEDIAYFREIKNRADGLVQETRSRSSDSILQDFGDLLGEPNSQLVRRIYSRMRTMANELNGPDDLSPVRQRHALLLMLLWKSAIVESRGSMFIVGVTIRYLEQDLRDSETDSETDSYKAWSVLATVQNTFGKYGEHGDAHVDMEKLIAETLSALLCSPVYRETVEELMQEEIYRYRGRLWNDPVRQKRYRSEVLFMFLKVAGDQFTALETGLFAISVSQREKREKWIKDMEKESDTVIKQYKIDRDGRYYRKFGWRSVIVYFGTFGALIIAGVVTALDLGKEGSNVFKRLNFFATLAVSLDLLVLGLFKIFDRNDKAVTDGLYFKHRVHEIDKEYNAKQYKTWRKAIAFNASKVADAVSPSNTCYASQTMTGDIVSQEKMQFDEIVDMFYIIEHGYDKNGIKMLNIKTGRQYDLTHASHIEPAPSYGIAYTGMVRKVRKSDNIDNLGASG